MDKKIRWAGLALVTGAILMLTRMGPIFAVLPENLAFPPASTEEMVRLSTIVGPRWQLSHAMGLAAVVSFAIAYVLYSRFLVLSGWTRVGSAVAAIAITGFGLIGVALSVDGFLVPAVIQDYLANDSGTGGTLQDIASAHELALRFFTPGVFLMFMATGLLSAPMLRGHLHARWQGLLGSAIAIVAVTAYVIGATGPAWNDLRVAGTLMMAAFAWHLIIGARAVFARRQHG